MNNKQQTFVFFGIVGSGKGTQVQLLEKYLKENNNINDILFISPGNEYRNIINTGNYTSQKIKERLEKGLLQPDFLTVGLLSNILISNIKHDTTIITDGFPRTINQSKSFEDMMSFFDRDDIKIIYIELSKEEATKRMKLRGRSDDTDDGIANRFSEYMNNVVPSMEYFVNKKGYSIYKINGDQSIEDVHKDIIKILNL